MTCQECIDWAPWVVAWRNPREQICDMLADERMHSAIPHSNLFPSPRIHATHPTHTSFCRFYDSGVTHPVRPLHRAGWLTGCPPESASGSPYCLGSAQYAQACSARPHWAGSISMTSQESCALHHSPYPPRRLESGHGCPGSGQVPPHRTDPRGAHLPHDQVLSSAYQLGVLAMGACGC